MNPKFRSALAALSVLVMMSACREQKAPDDASAGPEAPAAAEQAPAHPAAGIAEPGREFGPDGMHLPDTPARDTSPVDARIVDVTLSNQGDTETNVIGPPTSLFGPQDTVYAEVHSQGSAQEYTIYAKWISADGSVLSDYGIRVNQAVDARTLISLSKPDGLESGENRIEIAINGQPARTVTYRVR